MQIIIFTSLVAVVVIAFLCSDHSFLLTAPLSGRMGDGYAVVTHEAAWIPEKAQIIQAKEHARVFLEAKLKSAEASEYTKREVQKILSRWPSYRFQVFGRIDGGRKIMHLSFMPEDSGAWSQNRLVQVCDGGAAYWQIDYDPETRSIVRFASNGYA